MVQERLKVLIVDDDPFIAEMYRLRLEADGYQVLLARDGEEGLALARSARPNLISLDYRLPGINGLDVLKQLKEGPTATIPVIMLSNDGDPAIRAHGLRLGVVMFVVKADMTPAGLAAVIGRTVLTASKATA